MCICIQQGVLKLCRICPSNFWGNTLWVYNIHILLPEIWLLKCQLQENDLLQIVNVYLKQINVFKDGYA